MFYSYWAGDSTSSLSGVVVSSEMDGGSKAVIIESRTIEPSHLQVDFIHRRLYIADSRLQVIEHFDFQGNNRKVVLRGHHVNAFVLLPDLLIWSEHNGIFKKNWYVRLDWSGQSRTCMNYMLFDEHWLTQPRYLTATGSPSQMIMSLVFNPCPLSVAAKYIAS